MKWLALRAPALYKDSEWALPKSRLKLEQGLEAYRRQPVRPDESRALRACLAFTGDVLIVESENDSLVPHQVIANYREAFISAKSTTYRVISAPITRCRTRHGSAPIRRCSSPGSAKWCWVRAHPNPRIPRPPPKVQPVAQPAAARPTAETAAGNNAVTEPLERRQ